MVARARKALGKLLQEACGPDDSHICIVGHGRINRLLLASLLYADATRFGHIEQGNTAITCSVVDYDPDIEEAGTGGWTEVVLNYCAHTEYAPKRKLPVVGIFLKVPPSSFSRCSANFRFTHLRTLLACHLFVQSVLAQTRIAVTSVSP